MAARAILFDLFDTLIDLRMDRLPFVERNGRKLPLTFTRLHELLSQAIDIDFESFASAMGSVEREGRKLQASGREYPTTRRYADLLHHFEIEDPGLVARLTEAHMSMIRSSACFLPHHAELLAGLRKHFRIGICSNFSHQPTAEHLLREAGLWAHLDVVVISEEVGLRKPRAEIFQAALDRLGVRAEHTLHVGDDLRADVAGAAGVGIRPVWITRRVRDPQETLRGYPGTPPARIIQDLRELPALEDSPT